MKTTNPATPTAVGYVSARDRANQSRQIDVLVSHARSDGLWLTRILLDVRGGWTISELVAVVGDTTDVVLLPGGVHLAEAHARLTADLAGRGMRVVVVDDAMAHPSDERPAARLSATLRRRGTAPVPA